MSGKLSSRILQRRLEPVRVPNIELAVVLTISIFGTRFGTAVILA